MDASEILLDGRPVQEKCFSPVQMIYQNPEFAVNPRIKAGESLKEPWDPDEKLMERMGIEDDWLKRWHLNYLEENYRGFVLRES